MSKDEDDVECCCCHRKQQQNAEGIRRRFTRLRLFYIVVFVSVACTLYLYSMSGLFSNVTQSDVTLSESTVVPVVRSLMSTTPSTLPAPKTTLPLITLTTNGASSATETTTTSSPASTFAVPLPTSRTVVTLSAPEPTTWPTQSTTVFLLTSASTVPVPTSTTTATSYVLSSSGPPTKTTEERHVNRYVSFHGGFADGRGLGNQMFNLASVEHVASITGRQPAILKFNYTLGLDEVFDMKIKRFDNLCPCYVFGEYHSLRYDSRLQQLVNGSYAETARDQSIFLCGFFQSWKYTLNVEHRLRQDFTFRREIRQFVDAFLADSRPPGWLDGYVRVGVHVRRGDVLNSDKVEFGYTTPDERYFANAMRYFVDRFERVQFIVASNDIGWCRQNLSHVAATLPGVPHRVDVTFLTPRSPGEDLAVLASCNHVIMSTGSYGWWAAWLAQGITIYYSDWPRKDSTLANMFSPEDWFLPHWIGMTDTMSST